MLVQKQPSSGLHVAVEHTYGRAVPDADADRPPRKLAGGADPSAVYVTRQSITNTKASAPGTILILSFMITTTPRGYCSFTLRMNECTRQLWSLLCWLSGLLHEVQRAGVSS